jgi:fucose 4-O-acetylase-like acetyltransferase
MGTQQVRTESPPTGVGGWRLAWADNLKVALVAGVVVAHVLIAYTGVGTWVLDEPHVRDPLLSVLMLVLLLGALVGMPLFFLVAGLFTPPSLERKGTGRFIAGRALRLLVPMALFVLLLSPPIEYVDSDNVGWTGSFWEFVPTMWWPPAPGPTWFLGVLFVYSVAYAVLRAVRPRREQPAAPLRTWHLVVAGLTITVLSFVVRLAVPLGEEWARLAIGQAPAWTVGFAVGVLAGENGWIAPLAGRMAKVVRWTGWAASLACLALIVVEVTLGSDLEAFMGGGTWQSLVLALLEGPIVVGLSLWLVDVFQRRFGDGGALARGLGRAAYATFFIHQLVLVALVVAVRQVSWPPEVEFLTVAVLGVSISFGLGMVLVRLPGTSRIL